METKISEAQLSVWEWKEKAYERIKNLPISEQMQAIHEMAQKTVEEINDKKRQARALSNRN